MSFLRTLDAATREVAAQAARLRLIGMPTVFQLVPRDPALGETGLPSEASGR